LKSKERELSQKFNKESKFKGSDITAVGGYFDIAAFNAKVNKIQEIARQRRKIKEQIKLARLNYRPLDVNQLTIEQLKQGLYLDTYNMFEEIKKMRSFNLSQLDNILSKNYRKMTVLIIFLIILISTYALNKFLE